MQKIFLLPVLMCCILPTQAQFFIGPKIGANYATMGYQDKKYISSNNYTLRPVFAYQAGLAMSYVASKRWSIQIEVNYTQKGREIFRRQEDYVYDLLRYQYIEVPLLFRISFGGEKFRWYLNTGPHISYFLSGRGAFSSSILRRGIEINSNSRSIGGPDILKYGLVRGETITLTPTKRNRIQLGIDVGGGIIIPVIDQDKLFFLDLRYSHTQSNIAKNNDVSITQSEGFLPGHVQNYAGANRVISVSIGFLFNVGTITAY